MKAEIYNSIAGLLNELEIATNELKVSCNDGAVVINVKTWNFTYMGKFGSAVVCHLVKSCPLPSLTDKLTVLASHMHLYSTNFGGFTLTNN